MLLIGNLLVFTHPPTMMPQPTLRAELDSQVQLDYLEGSIVNSTLDMFQTSLENESRSSRRETRLYDEVSPPGLHLLCPFALSLHALNPGCSHSPFGRHSISVRAMRGGQS